MKTTDSLTERIRAWNTQRGMVDGNFDPQLEIKLLSEELHEFSLADTYPHALQEAADFTFVMTGTMAKWWATKFESHNQFALAWAAYKDLGEWLDEANDYVTYRLMKLAPRGYAGLVQRHKKEALRLVTEANEAKPATKNQDGKVIKGDDYRSPLDAITEYLRDEGAVE